MSYLCIKLINHTHPNMKKILLLSMLAAASSALWANTDKIDLESRCVLDAYRQRTLAPDIERAVFMAPQSRGGASVVKVLVETDGNLPTDMPYNSYQISQNFYTVDIPADEIENFADNDEVVTMSFGRVATAHMDIARGEGAVTTVHKGAGLGATLLQNKPHKGEGVVAGMYDTGFDPSHINWKTADGTANRLKYFIRIDTSYGTINTYEGDQAPVAPTDNAVACHGTHVAGIMAGAYNGAGTYYGTPTGTGAPTEQTTVPLYGVAPEADMVIGAGSLATSSIIEGVKRIVNYAAQQGKPVAVNLSLGNNSGPHDGTDSDVRALDAIVDETGAIIVIAAGNDGDIACHAGKTFTAADKKVAVLFEGNSLTSGVDVWSSTTDPFTVSIVAADAATGAIVAKTSSKHNATVAVGADDAEDEASVFFNTYFTGAASLASTVNAINKRARVYVSSSNMKPTSANGGKYLLGLMIEGNEGVRVDAYGSKYAYFASPTVTGFDYPDANGSISGMACGKRTICVGAFTTRNNWYTYLGYGPISYTSGAALNSISDFSSWGDLVDGRSLPHVAAPGQAIASSYSTPYVQGNNQDPYDLMATATVADKTYYWGSMQGTSMACPFVTGVMCLWLQADPNLTVDSALDILSKTSTAPTYNSTAWGYGKINAYKGIKEVLARKNSGIGNIAVGADASDIAVARNGSTIEVFAAGAGSVTAELYSISGQRVASVTSTSDTAALDTDALPRGVYVLRAAAGQAATSVKIAL